MRPDEDEMPANPCGCGLLLLVDRIMLALEDGVAYVR